MSTALSVQHQHSLRELNSFGLAPRAELFFTLTDSSQLSELYTLIQQQGIPPLLVGSGSNLLLLDNYAGLVVSNRLLGVQQIEHEHFIELHVSAGEDWPELVAWSVAQGYGGLENLADIPGTVGAAPVQNIGAYGAELADVCLGVEYLDLSSGDLRYLDAKQCEFAYRQSIFKLALKQQALITRVDLALPKQWQANRRYAPLNQLAENCSVAEVFATVCELRREKLPDPKHLGNAGSFFKNPLVCETQLNTLLAKHPALPHYPAGQGQYKLAAAWLIDQLGLKGFQLGGAAVHLQQALVLVNKEAAVAQDIVLLCQHIRQQVFSRYHVFLEPEVRFISACGEIEPTQVLGMPS